MPAVTVATLKSFSIMWAEGVTDGEAATVVSAVKELVKLVYDVCTKAGVPLSPTTIRPFGTWVIPSQPAGSPYSSIHWYVDTAYDRRLDQVVAGRFLELVKQEPWQQERPHFDVAVLDRDLTERDGRSGFVLASSLPGTATVISVHRLRELDERRTRAMALRRLVVHNLGHVLEIPSARRPGITAGAERHCPELCAMRPAATVDQFVLLAREEADRGVVLCASCRQELLHKLMAPRLTPN